MGIIDKVTAVLVCTVCGAVEEQQAVQTENEWGPFGEFKLFRAHVFEGVDGPEVRSATCIACNATATVRERYG